jgi:hypothetical protein
VDGEERAQLDERLRHAHGERSVTAATRLARGREDRRVLGLAHGLERSSSARRSIRSAIEMTAAA